MGLGADLGADRDYLGKVLFVKAGESLSLQFHRERTSRGTSQSGRAQLELGDAGEAAADGGGRGRRRRSSTSRPGTVHRVTALEDTTIVEVSTPHPDDVVRLEDSYGREGTNAP